MRPSKSHKVIPDLGLQMIFSGAVVLNDLRFGSRMRRCKLFQFFCGKRRRTAEIPWWGSLGAAIKAMALWLLYSLVDNETSNRKEVSQND